MFFFNYFTYHQKNKIIYPFIFLNSKFFFFPTFPYHNIPKKKKKKNFFRQRIEFKFIIFFLPSPKDNPFNIVSYLFSVRSFFFFFFLCLLLWLPSFHLPEKKKKKRSEKAEMYYWSKWHISLHPLQPP